MQAGYKLYGRKGSGSWVVEVALEEAGAAYETVWVGQDDLELRKYRSINPTGRVPSLVLPDGTVMMESAAMLLHVAASHPNRALAPAAGTSDHARFLQWMVFLSANLYEAVLRIYYSARFSARGEADAPAVREQATSQFVGFLEVIAPGLDPYVLGADYSLADPYLYMLTGWYPGEKSDLWTRLPKLKAHFERIAERPAVRKIDAEHAG